MDMNIPLLCITLGFIVLDLVTGIVKAVYAKNGDSTKMRQGLYHKLAFIIAMALGYLCEIGITYGAFEYAGIDLTVPISPFICGFIILTELASILENLGDINPELKNGKLIGLFGKGNEKQ